MTATATDDPALPEGWTLAALSEIVEINPPKPAKRVSADMPVTFVPMAAVDEKTGTIAAPQVRPFSKVRNGYTAFRIGDVIMAKITPCMENGKAAIAQDLVNGLGFGSTEFHVLRSRGSVLPEYVYHYIRRLSFRRSAESEMTGSVGQKRVPRDFLESVEIPVPPLPEQERIVTLLEKLIGKLQSSQDHLERIPGILWRFRQAVLTAACSGRLTERWREAHPEIGSATAALQRSPHMGIDLPRGWILTTIDDVVRIQNGRAFPSKEYQKTGVRLLRPGNLHRSGSLTWSETNTACLPREWAERFPDYVLKAGDLVMNLTAQSLKDEFLGRVCLKSDAVPALLNQRIARFLNRTAGDMRPYLFVYFRSPYFRAYVNGLDSGSLIRHMHSKQLLAHVFPLPPIDEQGEIVRRVHELLAFGDQVDRRIITVLEAVNAARHSSLSRAFAGELVPTEAELATREGRAYETAEELLRRVSASETAGLNGRRRGTRRIDR